MDVDNDNDGVDRASLPDTQQIEQEFSQVDEVSHDIWGRLYPIGFNLPPKDLTSPVHRVGRGPECDIQITSQNMDPVVLVVISKVQFEIKLEQDDTGMKVFSLLDLSSNGTFVNKKRIGKNEKVYLSNNDEISLAQPQNKAYLFVDVLACNSWLPLNVWSNYSIIKRLGCGAYGEVKLALEKTTGDRFAIKKILKKVCQNENDKNQIMNEIKILRKINHSFIITMKDIFESDDAVFIVLEYMPGGDLMKRIHRTKYINETDAKYLFYQLVLAVQYLHKEGITHRDLKPENILLSSENGDAILKLTDFGLSKVMHSTSLLKTFCGTLIYTAPEVIFARGARTYTSLVDVWSLGCILYLCLSGVSPFNIKKDVPIEEQIVRGFYPNVRSLKSEVSDLAADIINKMLVVNPLHRIGTDNILRHPWLQDQKIKSKVESILRGPGIENIENLSPEVENDRKRMRT